MADGDNNRVTVAVLATKIEFLADASKNMRSEHAKDVAETQRDLKYLSTQIVQMDNDKLGRIAAIEKSLETTAILIEALARAADKLAKTVTEHQTHKATMIERWKAHQKEHGRQMILVNLVSAAFSTISGVVATLKP